jgi:hypothetical protein
MLRMNNDAAIVLYLFVAFLVATVSSRLLKWRREVVIRETATRLLCAWSTTDMAKVEPTLIAAAYMHATCIVDAQGVPHDVQLERAAIGHSEYLATRNAVYAHAMGPCPPDVLDRPLGDIGPEEPEENEDEQKE